MKSPTTTGVWSRLAFALIFSVLALPLGFSQSKKDLEERRRKLIREIETTTKLLRKTNQIKEATLDRFVALQNQIEQREDLIQTLNDELAATDSSSSRAAAVIASLSRDVVRMQDEYATMMRSAFRRKIQTNPLLYILSAESLNQAFRRWMFLRKYDRYRREQAEAIAFTKKMLAKKMVALEEIRREKSLLIESMQGQKVTLTTEMQHKNELLQTLKEDESKLKTEIKEKETAHEELNRMIERVIQEEIRKKTEEARKPKKTKPAAPEPKPKPKPSEPSQSTAENYNEPDDSAPSEDEDEVTVAFRKNRGRLPWPVESGFISKKFGRQPHPTIPNIQITNNGIDIRTDDLTQVYSIFEGKVAGVQFIPGHDYTIIIQHGNYYTVYSNLRETYVEKGEMVKAKRSIGTVSTNKITGSSELHFELWHEKERLNPAGWIRK